MQDTISLSKGKVLKDFWGIGGAMPICFSERLNNNNNLSCILEFFKIFTSKIDRHKISDQNMRFLNLFYKKSNTCKVISKVTVEGLNKLDKNRIGNIIIGSYKITEIPIVKRKLAIINQYSLP